MNSQDIKRNVVLMSLVSDSREKELFAILDYELFGNVNLYAGEAVFFSLINRVYMSGNDWISKGIIGVIFAYVADF